MPVKTFNSYNQPKKDPIWIAARDGDMQSVECELQYTDVDINKKDGPGHQWTPLHIAVFKGHVEITSVLIDAGVDVNCTTINEITPLHTAAQNGFVNICIDLIDHGAVINAEDIWGATPLYYAVSSSNERIVWLLLKMGANPMIRTKDGVNICDMAFKMGLKDIFHLLMSTAIQMRM